MDQNQVSTRGPVSLGKNWVLLKVGALSGRTASPSAHLGLHSKPSHPSRDPFNLSHTYTQRSHPLMIHHPVIFLYFIKLTRRQQKLAYDEWDYSEHNFWQLILASPPLSQIVEPHSHKPIFLPNKIMLWKNIRTLCEIYFTRTFLMNSTIRKSFCFHFLFFSFFPVFGRLGSFPLVCAQLTITSS